MNVDVIDSVLGFDLKAEIFDNEGNLVRTGIKSTCHPETKELPSIGNNYGNVRWFTNFNESLLNKVRDYKRHNS